MIFTRWRFSRGDKLNHEHMRIFIKILLNTLAVIVAAYILPGVAVYGLLTAIVVAILLAAVNAVVRPILILLTLPATILTLGLFIFVINALMVMLVAWLVPGFAVLNFWWALLFSLVVSVVSFVLYGFAGEAK